MVARGTCDYNFKAGWWCSAEKGHDGPCPLRQEITFFVPSFGGLAIRGVTTCSVCFSVVLATHQAAHIDWHDQ